MKTAKQREREYDDAARALPLEVKKRFWKAMMHGMCLGDARKLAGIDDVMVAAQLVTQLHKSVHIPMRVEDIE